MAAYCDADVGGIPSGLALEHRMVPVLSSADWKEMTLMKQTIGPYDIQLFKFILHRDVTLLPLPDIQMVRTAFEEVLAATRHFQDSKPAGGTMFVPLDEEDLKRFDQGEPLPCCAATEEISDEQLRMMNEIRRKYDVFLEMVNQ